MKALLLALLGLTLFTACTGQRPPVDRDIPVQRPATVVDPNPPSDPVGGPADSVPVEPVPELLPRCVAIPGLDATTDGFVQVGQALIDEAGTHALQWICREHDWRMRLQTCAGDCQSGEWKDVGELRLPELEKDEVLVFGLDGCANLRGDPVIGLALRGSGPMLDHVRRAWAILIVEPFGFREIDPAGVRCQNPDHGI